MLRLNHYSAINQSLSKIAHFNINILQNDDFGRNMPDIDPP